MNYSFKRPSQFKRYTAFVLVMFVVSVLNMGMHAAMQSMSHIMQMADPSGMVQHSAMQQTDCGCPPSLCESVDAQHNQLAQSVSLHSLLDLLAFYPIFVSVEVDAHNRLADISFHYYDWQYHQHASPPLSLNTLLLI
jgi:hypothetical protein